MKPAKFALDHLFYPELSIKANQQYVPEDDVEPSQPAVSIFLNKAGTNMFNLGLKLNVPADVPSDKYSIEAIAVGAFRLDETLPEDQQVRLIAQSGPNLVFGALRDMIATVTGRGPWGEYYLQPQMIQADDFISHDGPELGME